MRLAWIVRATCVVMVAGCAFANTDDATRAPAPVGDNCSLLSKSCVTAVLGQANFVQTACQPGQLSEQALCYQAASGAYAGCIAPSPSQCGDGDWQRDACGQGLLYLDRQYIRGLGYAADTRDQAQVRAILATIPEPAAATEATCDAPPYCVSALAPVATRYVPGACYKANFNASRAWSTAVQSGTRAYADLNASRVRDVALIDNNRDVSTPDFGTYGELLDYRAENRNSVAVRRLLQSWEANQATMTSCEEYVYEKYYDYTRWLLEARNRTPREQYNLAVNTFGWSSKYYFGQRVGGTYSTFSYGPSVTEARSFLRDPRVRAYAQALASNYAVGTVERSRIDRLLALRADTVTANVAWHVSKSTQLALGASVVRPRALTRNDASGASRSYTTGFADEELDELDRVLDMMLADSVDSRAVVSTSPSDLLNRWGGVVIYSLQDKSLYPNADTIAPQDVAGNFLASLATVDQAGCLVEGANACDWSPRRFARSIGASKASRRAPFFRAQRVIYSGAGASASVSTETVKEIGEVMEDDYARCRQNVPDVTSFNNGASFMNVATTVDPPSAVTWQVAKGETLWFWSPTDGTSDSTCNPSAYNPPYTGTDYIPSVFSTRKQVIDYTRSVWDFEKYLYNRDRFKCAVTRQGRREAMKRLARIAGASVDPYGNVLLPGVNSSITRSANERLGSEWFGIAYDYSYTQNKAGATSCQQDLTGSFNSSFLVLTADVPLLGVNGYWKNYRSSSTDKQANIDISVLGLSIFSPSSRPSVNIGSGSFSLSGSGTVGVDRSGERPAVYYSMGDPGAVTLSWSLDQMTGCSPSDKTAGNCALHRRMFGFANTIQTAIGPVPVFLQYGGSGFVGLNGTLDLRLGSARISGAREGCLSASVGVTFEPYVRIALMAAAGVGNPQTVALGLRVNLDLFRFGIPISATLEIAEGGGGVSPGLTLNLTGAMRGSLLSGSVEAFLKFFFLELSYTLIEWQGPSFQLPLFNYSFNVNFEDEQALNP